MGFPPIISAAGLLRFRKSPLVSFALLMPEITYSSHLLFVVKSASNMPLARQGVSEISSEVDRVNDNHRARK
jgi:hypothetical protein